MTTFLTSDWPAPTNVKTLSTTRGVIGYGLGPYARFNLAMHVGDDETAVLKNRELLRHNFNLPAEPYWLQQVHGTGVLELSAEQNQREADAALTWQKDQVCVVMTADCLPVLFCDWRGTVVAAAHAGWRGLAAGVLEETVSAMGVPAEHILAWFGPAIGPDAFEVGCDVKEVFVDQHGETDVAFKPGRNGRFMADIYELARIRLNKIGCTQIYGGDLCTYSDPERFYSYRRDKQTGRQASLIWLAY